MLSNQVEIRSQMRVTHSSQVEHFICPVTTICIGIATPTFLTRKKAHLLFRTTVDLSPLWLLTAHLYAGIWIMILLIPSACA
jgi:hypothetical protein